MSADFDPEDEQQIREQLAKEAIRPPHVFRGEELWPYTKAARMLYNKLTTDTDTIEFCALAFVYILTKRNGASFKEDAKANLCGWAWDNPSAFRIEVLDMANSLTDEDVTQAIRITDEELELSLFSKVTPIPEKKKKGQSQKKTPSGPPAKRGSVTNSRKKSR